MSAGVGDAEARFRLYRFIDGSAGALRYVDAQEEENIFRKAESMGIWKGQAEAMLNHRCKRHKWTREKEIVYYIRIMLEKACTHSGRIKQEDFEHVVDFAAAVRMPRRDAVRICCGIIRKAGWKPSGGGLFGFGDWFSYYER